MQVKKREKFVSILLDSKTASDTNEKPIHRLCHGNIQKQAQNSVFFIHFLCR